MRISAFSHISLPKMKVQSEKTQTQNNVESSVVSFGALDRSALDYQQWEQNFDVLIPRRHPPRPVVKIRQPISSVVPPEVEALKIDKLLKLSVPEFEFMDIRDARVNIRKFSDTFTTKDGKREVAIEYFKRRLRQCLSRAHEVRAKVLTQANCDLCVFGKPGERILYGHTPDYKYSFVKEIDLQSIDKVTIYKNYIPTEGNRIMEFCITKNGDENITMWDSYRNSASIINSDYIIINDRIPIDLNRPL